MTRRKGYGLLIDYEYCTGCYTCQVACAQEYQWPEGMSGMKVIKLSKTCPRTGQTSPTFPSPPKCARYAGLAPSKVWHRPA